MRAWLPSPVAKSLQGRLGRRPSRTEIASAGRERARVLLVQARADAVAERARVTAELMARTQREVSGFVERARAEAAEVEREAGLRGPGLAIRVVARVKRNLSTLDGEAR